MSTSNVIVSTTCYRPDINGTIEGISGNYYTPKTDTGYSPCCFSTSVYIEDNVCFQADAAVGSAGYYMALCTDPTYKDPSCTQDCVAYTKGDIVYTDDEWRCCGADSDGNPACSTPESEVVNGVPAPNVLQSVLSASSNSVPSSTMASSSVSGTTSVSTTRTSTTSTSTGLTSMATNTSKQPLSTSQDGLSTGAKTGIGAVVGILIVVLIAVLAFFLVRRNKLKKHMGPQLFSSEIDGLSPPIYSDKVSKGASFSLQPVEMMDSPSQPRIHEIG